VHAIVRITRYGKRVPKAGDTRPVITVDGTKNPVSVCATKKMINFGSDRKRKTATGWKRARTVPEQNPLDEDRTWIRYQEVGWACRRSGRETGCGLIRYRTNPKRENTKYERFSRTPRTFNISETFNDRDVYERENI